MGSQGMWNSTSSEASSNTNDLKRKKGKTEADTTTPEELEPNYQPINWKRVFLAPKYIPMWIILIAVGVLTAIITLKHDEVVDTLRPFAEKVRNIPAGWLIFVAVLVIISFPPLFGHEVVALLAGVVYGLWIGFAVVSAGTFLGESELSTLSRAGHRTIRGPTWRLTILHSRNMVRLQEVPAKEGREDGADESHVRRHGEVVP